MLTTKTVPFELPAAGSQDSGEGHRPDRDGTHDGDRRTTSCDEAIDGRKKQTRFKAREETKDTQITGLPRERGQSPEKQIQRRMPAEGHSAGRTLLRPKWVWNHTIGREFLRKVTSPNGHIQYWDIFSGKMMGIQSMGGRKIPGERLPQDVTEFEPSKFGIDNFHCQIQGACNRHDHKAFETVETPKLFKGNEPDHQTRIAMRAAFAENGIPLK